MKGFKKRGGRWGGGGIVHQDQQGKSNIFPIPDPLPTAMLLSILMNNTSITFEDRQKETTFPVA